MRPTQLLALLVAILAAPSTAIALSPSLRSRLLSGRERRAVRRGRANVIRAAGPRDPRDDDSKDSSLYTNPLDGGVELDAVTVTALLGAAIAFQFFVVANL
mmetsp:Transcript_18923/g.60770  ORF Transcript_18923/g.60770 Transcript_18923/m.60770 type:complete len:101 (-) Transcript_18923:887-1189(-)